MAINIGDPIAVKKGEEAWVHFVVRDLTGNLASGLDLSTFIIYYLKQNSASLGTLTITPNINLKEVGQGVYRALFSAADLDTTGTFVLLAEVPSHMQAFQTVYVISEDGVEGGILTRTESYLPWHAIQVPAASGVTGLIPDGIFYAKSGDSNQVVKPVIPSDIRDLGRGLYSIKFSPEELDTPGPFTYTVLDSGADPFIFLSDVVLGTNDLFEFELVLDNESAVGYTIEVRDKATMSLQGSVITGSNGKAQVTLERGEYIATIVNGTTVFNQNNHLFCVSDQPDANSAIYDVAGLTPGVQPTPTTVTGSVELQTMSGEAVSDHLIILTIKQLSVSGGVLYLGTKELKTDPYGKASIELVPGLLITVSVQGTRLFREYTVPAADFNLITEAIGVADPITIQTPTFPVAPIHT